MLKKQTRA